MRLTPAIRAAFWQVRAARAANPTAGKRAISTATGISTSTVQRTLEFLRYLTTYPEESWPARYPELFSDAPAQAAPPRNNLDDWLLDRPYLYHADTDTYVTFLKAAPKPVVVPGSKHRAMLEAYSRFDGQPQTINELCRQFGIPREWFVEYKRVHGWTHDHEPVTAEEMLTTDTDELVAIALQKRRAVFHQRFERERWREIEADAQRYRRIEALYLEPLTQLARQDPAPRHVPRLVLSKRARFMALVNVCDVHYGKYASRTMTGNAYGRDLARRRLLRHFEDVLQLAALHGEPEKIVIALMGDLSHVDNKLKATTALTPQDSDGNALEILIGAMELPRELIERARQLSHQVEVEIIPGNHDEMFSGLLAKHLSVVYERVAGVTVGYHQRRLVVRRYGVTCYVLEHGHHVRPDRYGTTVASRARQHYGATHFTEVITGDKHHLREQDYGSYTLRQGMSLAANDLWHDERHYLSRRGLNGYVIYHDEGIKASLTSPVLPGEDEESSS